MKKNILFKGLIFFGALIITILMIPKEVSASTNKQTWRINPVSNLQKISLQAINVATYSKNYKSDFVNSDNKGWSGKTLYGGGLQGSVVTDRHIIFAVLSGNRQNGYIYVANKTTGVIEQSIPVASAGSTSIYGHLNDMTYNPKTKEVFIPYENVSGVGKVAIFNYNSNGSLNTKPTIVNQCNGLTCSNMDYNASMDKYIFNSGSKIYIVSRNGSGFKSTPDKTITYDQKDFKYMIPQSIATTGRYFYKMFYEDGEASEYENIYYDSKEAGSCIAAVYEIDTGKYVKGLYIPNTTVSAELEGISFDPNDGSMILAYNFYNEQKVKFYKLKSGNQVIDEKELYFYNNGLVAPKATITAEKAGISQNLIRYYNGNNNLGDGHSNYTKSWKDLAGKKNGTIEGNANFTNKGCLNLNGNNKWVNIGKMPDTIYNSVTMQIEVSFNEISDEEVDLLSNMELGGYALLMKAGKPAFQAHINGSYQFVKFDEKLLKNRSYNITGTFDGEVLSLYIDGVLRETKKISTKGTVKVPDNNTVMAIGTNPNGNNAAGGFINGTVYSARIYQSSLNEKDIQKNMNADRITRSTFASNCDNVRLTINFSESVANFSIDDIVVNNAKKGTLNKNSDKQYTIDISEIKESSNLEISIADGSFTDLTGNKGIGTSIVRYRDITGPAATITTDTEETTASKDIIYTISFHEKVTGFNKDDIIVTNGNKINFTEVTERRVYTVQVSNNSEGIQKIMIPEGACYDSSGNSNVEKSKTITINRTPTITITPNSSNIYSKNTYITININDTGIELSDSNLYQYSLSDNNKNIPDSGWTDYKIGEPVKIGEGITGTRYIWVKQIADKLGNKSNANQVSGPFLFDNTSPTITNVDGNRTEWKKEKITLRVDAEDNFSGLAEKAYSFDGGNTWQEECTKEYTKNTNNILIEVRDKLGNITKHNPISVTKIVELTQINLKQVSEKDVYKEGENFDKLRIKVEAIYNNGTTEEIKNFEVIHGENLKVGQTSVMISYTENGVTKTVEHTITVTNEEGLFVKFNNYINEEDNNIEYIEKLLPETSIETFKTGITTNGIIEIYRGNTNITNEKQLIETGMEIVIKLENMEKRYLAVVMGDLTGNGKMGIGDLSKLSRYEAQIDRNLEGAYLRASGVIGRGQYGGISNILKMSRILAGIDTFL